MMRADDGGRLAASPFEPLQGSAEHFRCMIRVGSPPGLIAGPQAVGDETQ